MHGEKVKKATAVLRNCNTEISNHMTHTFMYLLYVGVYNLVGLNMTITGGKILP